MKTRITLLTLSLSLMTGQASYAGYNEAVSAYERGEYMQALKELFSFFSDKDIDLEYQQWKQKIDAMGLPKNYDDVIPWLEKRAREGSAEAQYYLGIMYRDGLGIAKNPQLAQKWLEMAAKQGMGSAQYDLGLMQLGGGDLPTDYNSAIQWLQKSAGQGNGNAMVYMGKIYAEGLGVSPDVVLAYVWLTLAEGYITDKEGKQLLQQSRQTLKGRMSSTQLTAADEAIRILKQEIANTNF